MKYILVKSTKKMYIICKDLSFTLPTALSVQGKTVSILDVYLPELYNIPNFDVTVAADDTHYDVNVPSTRCSDVAQFAKLLRTHLGAFAKFTVKKNELTIEPLEHEILTFSRKISKMLNFPGSVTTKTTCTPDLSGHLQRVFICSPIVESSIVGNTYLPVLFHGNPDKKVSIVKHNLTIGHMNSIDLHLYDADLDVVESGPLSVTLCIESP